MNLELKNRIMKCLDWSVALYVCSRDVDVNSDTRLAASEMSVWRRMAKISWLDKVTNNELLRRVNEDRQILNCIWQRRHRRIDWPCFEKQRTYA